MQYGAELIPTEVRAQGIAAVHIAGYIASMISPYIVDLASESRRKSADKKCSCLRLPLRWVQ